MTATRPPTDRPLPAPDIPARLYDTMPRQDEDTIDDVELEDAPEDYADDESFDAAGPGAADRSLRAELDAVRAEKDAIYEKLARAQADYTNSRNRLEKDAQQSQQLALGRVLKAFLPVVDNLERALALDPDKVDAKAVLGGVNGTRTQFLEALKGQGVEPVAPDTGTPFDPNTMEALMQEVADYAEPTVTRLLQPGYTFNGRPLRPAQVAVSRSN